jgi:plastocyanin
MRMLKTSSWLKLVLVTFAILLFVAPSHLLAADASVIKVYDSSKEEGKMVLDPPDLYITNGTVVIWMNGFEGSELEVSFDEGKACQDVTVSPAQWGFKMSKTCFVMSYIPYAATSSLKFTQAGTFKYTVSTMNGKSKTNGKIIVRDL